MSPILSALSEFSSDLISIPLCRRWALSYGYTLLSGTTDFGDYICYYDPITTSPRDYYIDQYDYTTHDYDELQAVLAACTKILETL